MYQGFASANSKRRFLRDESESKLHLILDFNDLNGIVSLSNLRFFVQRDSLTKISTLAAINNFQSRLGPNLFLVIDVNRCNLRA